MNMTGALRVRVGSAATGTLLDEVNALLEKAIEQRSSYVKLADRAARLYAPVVHLTALATFLGWIALGLGWQPALVVAITVLIITCPCALGLAVPAVQVVAASAMFRRGVMLNSGDALERLADVDTVVFDKTGHADAAAARASPTPPTSRPRISRSPVRSRSRASIRSPRRSPRRRAPGRRSPRMNFPARASRCFTRASGLKLGSRRLLQGRGGSRRRSPPLARRVADRVPRPRARVVFAVRQALAAGRAAVIVARLPGRGSRSRSSRATGARRSRKSRANSAISAFSAGLKPADKIARLKALREADGTC